MFNEVKNKKVGINNSLVGSEGTAVYKIIQKGRTIEIFKVFSMCRRRFSLI